jgi:NAD(P)-dependent dehydrogenase (short-subunit alcohol dehydrogenase family)
MATVLITGGNRGIGLALAERYLARGDNVFVTIRSGGAKQNSKKGLTMLQADVTDTASLQAAQRDLKGQAIDLLICNAGMNAARGGMDAAENTAAAWASLLATNVTGAFFTAQVFAPHVIKARGKIAIISSRMGSSTAAAGSSYLYRASKAAVSNIAANLAVELKPKGVAVASYHPGWVKTDMGGSGADIDVATSAAGLIKQFDALSIATTGGFFNYDGTAIPY